LRDELGAFFDHLHLIGVRGLVAEQLSDAEYQAPPRAKPTSPNRKARRCATTAEVSSRRRPDWGPPKKAQFDRLWAPLAPHRDSR